MTLVERNSFYILFPEDGYHTSKGRDLSLLSFYFLFFFIGVFYLKVPAYIPVVIPPFGASSVEL